jgi:anti-anti-sigma factor
MEMNIFNRSTGVLLLEGNLTGESEGPLNSAVNEAHRKGISNIVLDFRPTDHMDSRGAAALAKLVVLADSFTMNLYAYALSAGYLDIFNLTGLSDRIPVYNSPSGQPGILTDSEFSRLKSTSVRTGKQDNHGWSPPVERLKVTDMPEKALNKNVDNRRVFGPLQGFGCLWLKTYLLDIHKPGMTPAEVITIMKQHFPEFQPAFNKFYPSPGGIGPGEIVLIDSRTPGGIVSTGVLVLYADDTSFSLLTPAGHPEAGWVTFSAAEKEDFIEMKIQGLASASDPFYEFAFRLVGSSLQEQIWKHVLSSLASYIGIEEAVRMEKTLIDNSLHWNRAGNFWYNAQIRSLPLNLTRLFGRK